MATETIGPGYWDRETDDELLCVDVHSETHDVKTFTFVAPSGKHVRFQAGQHFAFEVGDADGTQSRCYSISSSPMRTNAISVTVKRVAGGSVSNRLHDTLVPGMMIKANGPLGTFVRLASPGAKLLLISAGSGITPLMSVARELADLGTKTDVVFVHAGRTPRDFIFRSELAVLADRITGFRLHLLPEDVSGERSWPGLQGRISQAYLALAAPDIAQRRVMCCGPAPFMAAVRDIVGALGVPPDHYAQESFDGTSGEEWPTNKGVAAGSRTFRVEFSKQNRSLEVSDNQTVLAAAKKAGLRLPYSCANGVCGTCKSKLASGKVDMTHGGGIRQREIDAGFFLPCCAKPQSDLVIER